MNATKQIYQDVIDFTEPLALEVLHFVEFLKMKKQLNMTSETEDLVALDTFLKPRIEAAEQGVVVNKSVQDIFVQVHEEEML